MSAVGANKIARNLVPALSAQVIHCPSEGANRSLLPSGHCGLKTYSRFRARCGRDARGPSKSGSMINLSGLAATVGALILEIADDYLRCNRFMHRTLMRDLLETRVLLIAQVSRKRN